MRKKAKRKPAKPNIVIYGAGGQGRVTLDLLRGLNQYNILGFLDDNSNKHGDDLDGLPVLGGEAAMPGLQKKKLRGVVLAVTDGKTRQKLYAAVLNAGFNVLGFVHPEAEISKHATLHPTAMIWPQAVVNVAATIGMSAIVCSGTILEHEVEIGNFSLSGSGSVLCAQVVVGERTLIGAHTVVGQQLHIGSDTTIGAGSVVTADIANGVNAFGSPCKVQF